MAKLDGDRLSEVRGARGVVFTDRGGFGLTPCPSEVARLYRADIGTEDDEVTHRWRFSYAAGSPRRTRVGSAGSACRRFQGEEPLAGSRRPQTAPRKNGPWIVRRVDQPPWPCRDSTPTSRRSAIPRAAGWCCSQVWAEKITVNDHPELRDRLEDVLDTVAAPDHAEPDPRLGRDRYYRRGVGPVGGCSWS